MAALMQFIDQVDTRALLKSVFVIRNYNYMKVFLPIKFKKNLVFYWRAPSERSSPIAPSSRSPTGWTLFWTTTRSWFWLPDRSRSTTLLTTSSVTRTRNFIRCAKMLIWFEESMIPTPPPGPPPGCHNFIQCAKMQIWFEESKTPPSGVKGVLSGIVLPKNISKIKDFNHKAIHFYTKILTFCMLQITCML